MEKKKLEKSLKKILKSLYCIKENDLLFIKKHTNKSHIDKKVVVYVKNFKRSEIIKYIQKKKVTRIVYKNENLIFCKSLFPSYKFCPSIDKFLKKILENLKFFINPNYQIISIILIVKKNEF